MLRRRARSRRDSGSTAAFPFDEKLLKRELAARKIGSLEIKKRGLDVDPAQLRTRLSLRGTAAATLILTRVAGKRTAILAERETPPPTSGVAAEPPPTRPPR